MYGGLFGDLPAAKNSKKKEEDEKSKDSFPTVKKEEKDAAPSPNNDKKRKVEEPKSVKAPSLVQTLGAAGTSMAFIPTHVNRKRNLVKKTPAQSQSKLTTTVTAATPSSLTKASSKAAKVVPPPQPAATTKFSLLSDEPITSAHDAPSNDDNKQAAQIHPSSTTLTNNTNTASEPEELRRLHDSVTDPYDPLVPNDLLQFWEAKAAILEREEIEREARETMEQQKRIREQLERERVELEKSGDINKIVEHRKRNALRARGRGRGVSNLPAWLVEKQKKEAQLGGVPTDEKR